MRYRSRIRNYPPDEVDTPEELNAFYEDQERWLDEHEPEVDDEPDR